MYPSPDYIKQIDHVIFPPAEDGASLPEIMRVRLVEQAGVPRGRIYTEKDGAKNHVGALDILRKIRSGERPDVLTVLAFSASLDSQWDNLLHAAFRATLNGKDDHGEELGHKQAALASLREILDDVGRTRREISFGYALSGHPDPEETPLPDPQETACEIMGGSPNLNLYMMPEIRRRLIACMITADRAALNMGLIAQHAGVLDFALDAETAFKTPLVLRQALVSCLQERGLVE